MLCLLCQVRHRLKQLYPLAHWNQALNNDAQPPHMHAAVDALPSETHRHPALCCCNPWRQDCTLEVAQHHNNTASASSKLVSAQQHGESMSAAVTLRRGVVAPSLQHDDAASSSPAADAVYWPGRQATHEPGERACDRVSGQAAGGRRQGLHLPGWLGVGCSGMGWWWLRWRVVGDPFWGGGGASIAAKHRTDSSRAVDKFKRPQLAEVALPGDAAGATAAHTTPQHQPGSSAHVPNTCMPPHSILTSLAGTADCLLHPAHSLLQVLPAAPTVVAG